MSRFFMDKSVFVGFCAALFMLVSMPGIARAQIEGDSWYEMQRDDGTQAPAGSADSTVSTQTIMASEAEVITNPSSLSWSGDPANVTDQQVTITNGGTLSSLGTVSVSASGQFRITANSCSSLSSGQSCQIRVRPNNGATGNFSGSVNISTQSGKSGSVSLSANLVPPAPPVASVSVCEWPGGRIRLRSAQIESGCRWTVTVPGTYTFRSISNAQPRYAFPKSHILVFQNGVRVHSTTLTHSTNSCRNGATRHTHRACRTAEKQQSAFLQPGNYTVKWYNSGYTRGSGADQIDYIRLEVFSGDIPAVEARFGPYRNCESRSGLRCN